MAVRRLTEEERAELTAERAAQGLPPKCEDIAALRRTARLLRLSAQERLERGAA